MANKTKYKVVGGCVKCMTCIYRCPMRAITMIPDGSAFIDPEKCVGCGSCYESCQPGAIVPYEYQNNINGETK